jgi:hypothetical protein
METTHYNDVIGAPAKDTPMTDSNLNNFDPADFLAKAGLGRTILYVQAKETRFRKGTRPTPSSIFSRGVSRSLSFHRRERSYPHASLDWRLIGEESITAAAGLRLVTATAITPLALL